MSYALRPGARVARGVTYLFVQGFISSVIGVVYFVILINPSINPNALRTEEMGVYSILTFVLTLVQVFGTFALSSSAVKYIAQYVAEGHPEKARSVVTRVLQISLLTSMVLSAFLFFFAEWLSMLLLGTLIWAPLFRTLAFASFFTILHAQIGGFLQGAQRIGEMAALGFIYTVVDKLLAIYLLYTGWGLLGVVCSWLAGLGISSFAGLILTARFLGIVGKPHPVKPLINFSYPLYLSGVLGFAADWVDRLFILPYMGAVYLGIYSVALRAAVVPGLISSSIVAALFPKLSELYAQSGVERLKEAFQASTRYAVLIGFPMAVGLAALAYPVLILFAGLRYVEAALPLTVLCLAMLPGALGIAIGPTLLTLERTKTASMLTIASIFSNTGVCYVTLATLNLGMLGTAWARVFASFIGFGLGAYVLRRILKVTFDKEAIWKASAACIIMTIAVFSLETLIYQIYLLPIYVIIGSAVYFFSLIALKAIKKHDIELIYNYLPSGLKWLAVWLDRVVFIA